MDTKKKIIIAIGVIGLALVCGGAVMGGGPSSIPAMFSGTNPPEGILSTDQVKTADVHSIELNLVNSNITINSGKNFDLTGTGVYNSYIKDGVFYAGADNTKNTLNVFGLKISVPSKWVCGYGSYVLTIPPKASLDTIKINTFHCDIAADTLKASNLDINMKAGDITVNHAIADTLSVAVTGGKTTITNPQVSGSGNIKTSGSISIGDEAAEGSSLCNVSLSSFRGDISLIGGIAGTSQIQTDFGDVTLTLPGSNTDYGLTAQEGELAVNPPVGADAATCEHIADITFICKHGNASVNFR